MGKSIQILKKKPIPVEAVQWVGGGESRNTIQQFLGDEYLSHVDSDGVLVIEVVTKLFPFRLFKLRLFDWLLKDIEGNFYPVKSSVIKKTYDVIDPLDYIDEFGCQLHSGD